MIRRLLLTLLASVAVCGCSKAPPTATTAPHAHTAPHGGTLVELGEHAYALELVLDPADGRLTAWVLDAHAENFVRIAAREFEVVATVAGTPRSLRFAAIANPATGETVGATAQFEAQADWLRTTPAFDALLTSLEVRGTTFSAVAFHFPRRDSRD